MQAVQKTLKTLIKNNKKLCCAESITGGLIASAIVDLPGASEVFCGSLVTYTDKAKHDLLNIPKKTLKKHGAVSHATAALMAKNALKVYNADYALASTGFAGPAGDDVGLCFIGLASKYSCHVYRLQLSGERNDIRRAAALSAYIILNKFMKGNNNG